MYTIAFVACLTTAQCRAFELQTEAALPVACLSAAQGLIAEWLNKHSKWTIRAEERIRCIPPSRKGIDA